MSIPVSAVVLTKNEAVNLPACLSSLAWAGEIVVVDSLSADDSASIAQGAGARVVLHPFSNFAAQRNFAQTQAKYDWVLFIDADEQVSVELQAEIRQLADRDELARNNAYHIQRAHLISGLWYPNLATRRVTPRLRQSVRQKEVPRLLDRRQAVWERALHETVRVPEPHGVLDNLIYHYASTNLSLLFEDFNYYTDLEAARLHRTRTRVSLLEAAGRGVRSALYMYFSEGWYRTGEHGLLLASVWAYTKFMNYAKLWERIRIQNGKGQWTARDRALLDRFNVDDQTPAG